MVENHIVPDHPLHLGIIIRLEFRGSELLEYSFAFRMSETQKLHVVKIRAHKNRIGILVITEKQLYKGHKLGL